MNYDELLKQMKELHDRKGHDYSSGGEFENFEFATEFARPFSGLDKTFATILGIKFARLRALQGRVAKNESLEDTIKDITIYCSLWWSSKVPGKERATDTFQADVSWNRYYTRQGDPVKLDTIKKQDES